MSSSARSPTLSGSTGSTTRIVADRLQPEHGAQQEQRSSCRPGLGLHAVGYLTGYLVTPRSYPPNASGSRPSKNSAASRIPAAIWAASSLEAVVSEAPGHERAVERPDGADVVADRVVAPSPSASVRTPQPEKSRGPSRWRATAFAFDFSTMPLQSRWPLFDVSESTWLPSVSSARRSTRRPRPRSRG